MFHLVFTCKKVPLKVNNIFILYVQPFHYRVYNKNSRYKVSGFLNQLSNYYCVYI